jgi:L-seryl-tRNA(Ser) seleniumtransferase/D-glucosaminate-6-phosphate ammonia-lyase
MDIYEGLGIPKVINAGGMFTNLGGARLEDEVAAAMAEAGGHHVELERLFDKAGELIARLTKAEAGTVTSGAAAGIALSVAACVAGDDPRRIRQLPGPCDFDRREVVLQAGHWISFGAPVEQMVRLGGGIPIMAGAVNGVSPRDLEAAMTERTAAVLYIQSHHTVQGGMLSLEECVSAAQERDIPVIVDAAAEEDLEWYIGVRADLVTYSGGKAFGGPTSGLIAGRGDLVRAVRANNRGIGRTMKVGKEQIAGLMAALHSYVDRDEAASQEREERINAALMDSLQSLPHSRVFTETDSAGRAITRVHLHLDEATLGFTAVDLIEELRGGQPPVYPRPHRASLGVVMFDPRPLKESEVPQVISAVHLAYARRGYPVG